MLCPDLYLIYSRHYIDTFCPDKVYLAWANESKTSTELSLRWQLRESLVSQVSIVICLSSQNLEAFERLTICKKSKLGHAVPRPL